MTACIAASIPAGSSTCWAKTTVGGSRGREILAKCHVCSSQGPRQEQCGRHRAAHHVILLQTDALALLLRESAAVDLLEVGPVLPGYRKLDARACRFLPRQRESQLTGPPFRLLARVLLDLAAPFRTAGVEARQAHLLQDILRDYLRGLRGITGSGGAAAASAVPVRPLRVHSTSIEAAACAITSVHVVPVFGSPFRKNEAEGGRSILWRPCRMTSATHSIGYGIEISCSWIAMTWGAAVVR